MAVNLHSRTVVEGVVAAFINLLFISWPSQNTLPTPADSRAGPGHSGGTGRTSHSWPGAASEAAPGSRRTQPWSGAARCWSEPSRAAAVLKDGRGPSEPDWAGGAVWGVAGGKASEGALRCPPGHCTKGRSVLHHRAPGRPHCRCLGWGNCGLGSWACMRRAADRQGTLESDTEWERSGLAEGMLRTCARLSQAVRRWPHDVLPLKEKG